MENSLFLDVPVLKHIRVFKVERAMDLDKQYCVFTNFHRILMFTIVAVIVNTQT